MAKKVKHLPPDLTYPNIFDRVDYSTINGQELFFTLLKNGKEPYTKGWPNNGISDKTAIFHVSQDINNDTGYGLIHESSKTVALDIDNVEKTKAYFKKEFNDNGEALEAILDNSFRINSPKPNRDKAIFMLTDDQLEQLDAIGGNQIVQHTEEGSVVFEIRGRGGQDVFPPSLYLVEDDTEASNDD